MNREIFLRVGRSLLAVLWLAACNAITPTPVPTPTVVSISNPAPAAASALETKSNSGGSVDVNVTPQALDVGQVVAFKIAMNTHSVDLSDDMIQIVILRDDKGEEYIPTVWDGAGPGGHHRSGVLKFAALARKPKSIDLVIKGLAQVAERTFHWYLP